MGIKNKHSNKISSCFWGCFTVIVVGFVSIFGFPLCCIILGNIVSCVHKSPEQKTKKDYKSLCTGSKPYSDFYPDEKSGPNEISFKTSEGCDYIVIVKDTCGTVVNHVYIKGGDTSKLGVPNGYYNVFFYMGKDWNPDLCISSDVYGGFDIPQSLQKDGPLEVKSQNVQYTLYPVANGNLKLQKTSAQEAF